VPSTMSASSIREQPRRSRLPPVATTRIPIDEYLSGNNDHHREQEDPIKRRSRRKTMIERGHSLPITKPANLEISRGSVHCLPRRVSSVKWTGVAVLRRVVPVPSSPSQAARCVSISHAVWQPGGRTMSGRWRPPACSDDLRLGLYRRRSGLGDTSCNVLVERQEARQVQGSLSASRDL